MKIASIECLRLTRPNPVPTTPARIGASGPGGPSGNPHPIHRYPEFVRDRFKTPGEASTFTEGWVRVTAEDGTWGLGHCHWIELFHPVVDKAFAPLLVGRECMAIELANDLMWRGSQRFGSTGIASAAQAAIDLALWDLKGKLLGVPVYNLLGGPLKDDVQLYVTTDAFEWAMELGFDKFKMRNTAFVDDGLEGINRLEERVARARDLIGPDRELMLNAVMSYTPEYAIRLIERLAPYRLTWVEEPLMPWDIEGHVRIKRACPGMPLATGETHRGRHVFRELVEQRAADILQPDIRWTGGLSETMKIHAIAEAAGIPTIPHVGGGMPAGQHFALAASESPMAEFMLTSAPGIPLAEVNRFPGMATPEDGRLKVSDAPGFGMEFTVDDFEPWS